VKRFLNALAGYILAVFAAAFVIALSVTPLPSGGSSANYDWASASRNILVFWTSAVMRIAIAAIIPALIGIIVASARGLQSTVFYCAWSVAIAIGLSLATGQDLSAGSLITLAIAGLAAGLAYRSTNAPMQ